MSALGNGSNAEARVGMARCAAPLEQRALPGASGFPNAPLMSKVAC